MKMQRTDKKTAKKMGSFDPQFVSKVMYMPFTVSRADIGYFDRIGNNLSSNHDWKEFLPSG